MKKILLVFLLLGLLGGWTEKPNEKEKTKISLVNLVETYLNRENSIFSEESISDFDMAIKLNPKYTKAYVFRGLIKK